MVLTAKNGPGGIHMNNIIKSVWSKKMTSRVMKFANKKSGKCFQYRGSLTGRMTWLLCPGNRHGMNCKYIKRKDMHRLTNYISAVN